MNNALKYHLIEPNESDIELSKKAQKALVDNDVDVINQLIIESTKSGNLKEALLALFQTIGVGEKLAIASSEKIVSSQEAADFLNVSRPYLNKLLDTGIIPSYRDGKHRRVSFKDILTYKVKRDAKSSGLDKLTEQVQEHGMGW